MIHEIFVKVKIDVRGNQAHVLGPQLHRVSNQLDLAPEDIVVDLRKEEFILLVPDLNRLVRQS